MSNILLRVDKTGAERLLNYILAYKRMIGEAATVNEKSSLKNTAILGLIPALEAADSIPNQKRHVKKRLQ